VKRGGKKQAAAERPPFANAERGEHDLTLGKKSYRLRPSHQAMLAIEQKTEKSTLALVRLGNTGDLTLTQLGIIAAELIRAGADPKDSAARNVDDERVAELIYEHGLPAVTSRLTLCLLDAATGGRTSEGEAKAAPATATDPAGAA
jgi:hypothetical protein